MLQVGDLVTVIVDDATYDFTTDAAKLSGKIIRIYNDPIYTEGKNEYSVLFDDLVPFLDNSPPQYQVLFFSDEELESFIHICTTLEQVEEWLNTLGRDRRYVQYIYY
jgi:hypothetical protein